MSHFYASIQGNRGEATRQGTAKTGITGHIRSWNVGARVTCYVDANGEDYVSITLTSGSGYSGLSKNLGAFKASDLD